VTNPTEGIDAGNRADITGVSTSAYTSFPLNATGIGWINKTGFTLLGTREGHDATNNAPSASATYERATFANSEYTGTDHDPYLDVTVSGGTVIPFSKINNGFNNGFQRGFN